MAETSTGSNSSRSSGLRRISDDARNDSEWYRSSDVSVRNIPRLEQVYGELTMDNLRLWECLNAIRCNQRLQGHNILSHLFSMSDQDFFRCYPNYRRFDPSGPGGLGKLPCARGGLRYAEQIQVLNEGLINENKRLYRCIHVLSTQPSISADEVVSQTFALSNSKFAFTYPADASGSRMRLHLKALREEAHKRNARSFSLHSPLLGCLSPSKSTSSPNPSCSNSNRNSLRTGHLDHSRTPGNNYSPRDGLVLRSPTMAKNSFRNRHPSTTFPRVANQTRVDEASSSHKLNLDGLGNLQPSVHESSNLSDRPVYSSAYNSLNFTDTPALTYLNSIAGSSNNNHDYFTQRDSISQDFEDIHNNIDDDSDRDDISYKGYPKQIRRNSRLLLESEMPSSRLQANLYANENHHCLVEPVEYLSKVDSSENTVSRKHIDRVPNEYVCSKRYNDMSHENTVDDIRRRNTRVTFRTPRKTDRASGRLYRDSNFSRDSGIGKTHATFVSELKKRELERRALERRTLELRDLKRRDFERRDLERRDLERRDLERRNLERQDIKRRVLEMDTERRDLLRIDLDRRDLERRNVERWDLEGRALERCSLKRRDFEGEGLERRDLKERDLDRKKLERRDNSSVLRERTRKLSDRKGKTVTFKGSDEEEYFKHQVSSQHSIDRHSEGERFKANHGKPFHSQTKQFQPTYSSDNRISHDPYVSDLHGSRSSDNRISHDPYVSDVHGSRSSDNLISHDPYVSDVHGSRSSDNLISHDPCVSDVKASRPSTPLNRSAARKPGTSKLVSPFRKSGTFNFAEDHLREDLRPDKQSECSPDSSRDQLLELREWLHNQCSFIQSDNSQSKGGYGEKCVGLKDHEHLTRVDRDPSHVTPSNCMSSRWAASNAHSSRETSVDHFLSCTDNAHSTNDHTHSAMTPTDQSLIRITPTDESLLRITPTDQTPSSYFNKTSPHKSDTTLHILQRSPLPIWRRLSLPDERMLNTVNTETYPKDKDSLHTLYRRNRSLSPRGRNSQLPHELAETGSSESAERFLRGARLARNRSEERFLWHEHRPQALTHSERGVTLNYCEEDCNVSDMTSNKNKKCYSDSRETSDIENYSDMRYVEYNSRPVRDNTDNLTGKNENNFYQVHVDRLPVTAQKLREEVEKCRAYRNYIDRDVKTATAIVSAYDNLGVTSLGTGKTRANKQIKRSRLNKDTEISVHSNNNCTQSDEIQTTGQASSSGRTQNADPTLDVGHNFNNSLASVTNMSPNVKSSPLGQKTISQSTNLGINPPLCILGEVAFQLERRILRQVFEGGLVMHSRFMTDNLNFEEDRSELGNLSKRQRFYGYTVCNLPEKIRAESRDPVTGSRDSSLEAKLQGRLKNVIALLRKHGYSVHKHSVLAQAVINRYGLFCQTPDAVTIAKLGLHDYNTVRNHVMKLASNEEREPLLVMVTCLNVLGELEGKPILTFQ